MPSVKPTRRTINGLPARRPFAGVMIVWRRVESEAGNHGEGVTFACVDGDPSAGAALSITAELGRAHRRADQTRRAQHIGNCSRTIIATIIKRFVTAAVTISLVTKLIACPDRAFHCKWRVLWRSCFAKAKTRGLSGHKRSRAWKKIAYC
jgi:hypothetical protein